MKFSFRPITLTPALCRFALRLIASAAWGLPLLPGTAPAQAPGTVDNSFAPDLNGFGRLSGVRAQPDGRVLVGGASPDAPGTFKSTVRLVRLRADGSVDATFRAAVGDLFSEVAPLTVQPDGRILVVGDSLEADPFTNHGRLARLRADGSLDRGFIPADFDFSGPAAAVVQPDGGIVIAGVFTQVNGIARTGLARLNANGSLDTGFDSNLHSYVSALAVQPDGRLLLGGTFQNVSGTAVASVVRLGADGSLDAGFTPVDVYTYGVGHGLDVHALAVQPDGRIVVGGKFTSVNNRPGYANLIRLQADGTLDPTFNARADHDDTPAPPGTDESVNGILAQPDGRLVLLGHFNRVDGLPAPGLARLDADGSRDTGFNADVNLFAAPSGFLAGLTAAPAGQVLLTGNRFDGPSSLPAVLLSRLFAGPTDPLPRPVLSVPAEVSFQVGNPNYSLPRIVASDSPTSYSAVGLPVGLTLDPITGTLTGIPLASGTFVTTFAATNATGNGTATATLTIQPGNTGTPTLSVSQDVAVISRGAGEVATVTFTRTGGDLAFAVNVAYAVSGPLVGGTDYVTLPGVKKIKAGRASGSIQVRPLPGGADGKLKLTVVSGSGYIVGSGAKARVKVAD